VIVGLGMLVLSGLVGHAGVVAGAPRKAERGTPRKATKAPEERQAIDTSAVWRAETEVFSAEHLAKLEPILRAARCRNEKTGCLYQDNGRPGTENNFAFRLIPWPVSSDPGYLVHADRCSAGGCDQGLFVRIDGRWRLLIEGFGVLRRDEASMRGFHTVVFRPRVGAPVRLVWDGRAYREQRD